MLPIERKKEREKRRYNVAWSIHLLYVYTRFSREHISEATRNGIIKYTPVVCLSSFKIEYAGAAQKSARKPRHDVSRRGIKPNKKNSTLSRGTYQDLESRNEIDCVETAESLVTQRAFGKQIPTCTCIQRNGTFLADKRCAKVSFSLSKLTT